MQSSKIDRWKFVNYIMPTMLVGFLIYGIFLLLGPRYNLIRIEWTLSRLREQKSTRAEARDRLEKLLRKDLSRITQADSKEQLHELATHGAEQVDAIWLHDCDFFDNVYIFITLTFNESDQLVYYTIEKWHISL